MHMLTLVHVGRFEGEREGQETGWYVSPQHLLDSLCPSETEREETASRPSDHVLLDTLG